MTVKGSGGDDMSDIMLEKSGDLAVTETGDIAITTSLQQEILIRLRWILEEWRLGPELGFPWFQNVLVKNPDTALIEQKIRDCIMGIDKIEDADTELVEYDRRGRKLTIRYTAYTDVDTISEEVRLYG